MSSLFVTHPDTMLLSHCDLPDLSHCSGNYCDSHYMAESSPRSQ